MRGYTPNILVMVYYSGQIIVNNSRSPTKLAAIWDDSPLNHDSRLRENSEGVMKFTHIYIYTM